MSNIYEIDTIIARKNNVPRVLLTQYKSCSLEALKYGILGPVKVEVFIACLEEMFCRLAKESVHTRSMEKTTILEILCNFIKTPDTNVLRPVKTVVEGNTGHKRTYPYDLRLFVLHYIKTLPLPDFLPVLRDLRNQMIQTNSRNEALLNEIQNVMLLIYQRQGET